MPKFSDFVGNKLSKLLRNDENGIKYSMSQIDHFVALCSMTILLVHIICKSSAMEIHIHLHNTHGCVLEKDNMVYIGGGWLQYVHKMQFV